MCPAKKQMLRDAAPLQHWQVKSGNFVTPEQAQAENGGFEPFDAERDHWYGPDAHYWFKTSFVVPQQLAQRSLVLQVRTQIDEWDDGKNPQFLLFLNGTPTQGLDMNHREVMLGQLEAGQMLDIQLSAYTGTLHTEFRLLTEVAALQHDVKELYYDLLVPLQGLERMPKDSKTRLDIETVLNDTINLLDFRTLYSPAYFEGVSAARAHIATALYQDMACVPEVVASCIGHTHIDVAWWWTVAQTREKVARSFATVLKLMEEYPEYKFMSSQPQLYQFLKERHPDLYAQVKQRVAEGRWETEGGMWVEADCNLTSGESLVRQFLYGKQFFKDEFGKDNRVLWLPDVFGYSAALPQICRKCGIDYFMTTKLSWNQFNKIPCDTFRWRGIDGSDIVQLGNIDAEALESTTGERYLVQQTPQGAIAYVENLPAKGFAGFGLVHTEKAPSPFVLHERSIETPFYHAHFDANGNLEHLFCKTAKRALFTASTPGNLLRMYEDKPMYYDNWDIDVFYAEKHWDVTELSALQWSENGPVRATLHLERRFSNSVLKQDIRFYANSPRIDFETWVDWKENQHLLKVLFPLHLNTDEATFSIQFGNVTRKTHKNTSWEQARFESCAQRWMDVSEGGFGVSLLNDCKYGHSVDDGVMGLTLIKSGIEPNPTTDQEEHWFTYSLLPHADSWKTAQTPLHAACLNQPAYAVSGRKNAHFSFAHTSHPNAVLETIKQAEDGNGTILRVYENQNMQTETLVQLHRAPAAAFSCDLLENNEEQLQVEGDCLRFLLKPFEIKTIRVMWE